MDAQRLAALEALSAKGPDTALLRLVHRHQPDILITLETNAWWHWHVTRPRAFLPRWKKKHRAAAKTRQWEREQHVRMLA